MKKGEGEHEGAIASMTLAGTATLFLSQDTLLHEQKWDPCKGGIEDPNINAGMLWIDRHIEPMVKCESSSVLPLYTLYGVERVGVASGHKYFGAVDWYQRGADYLIHHQGADGGWGDSVGTSFALLFLVRGRAPVMFSKLEWAGKISRDKKDVIPWNERPRDVANLAKWTGRRLETFLNWQVVSLTAPLEDLLDSPVVYVGGSQELSFKPEEIQKLRQYVEQGGMILGNADCGKQIFATSFKKLGSQLFPKYEFRPLPQDHPIFTNEQYPAQKWKEQPRLLGLSNGVRELMLLVPEADLSRAWQVESAMHRERLELGADIFFYAGDEKNLRQSAHVCCQARCIAGDANREDRPRGSRRQLGP